MESQVVNSPLVAAGPKPHRENYHSTSVSSPRKVQMSMEQMGAKLKFQMGPAGKSSRWKEAWGRAVSA